MKQRLPLALSVAALVVAVLSTTNLVAASPGVVRHALFADRAQSAVKAKRAKLADRATVATRATVAVTARNALAVSGFKASSTATPGELYPLGADGRLPSAIMPSAVAVRLVRTTSQTIPIQIAGADVTRVAFTTAEFQFGGVFFDPAAPTILTVPQDGIYLITAQVDWHTQSRSLAATWGFNRAVTIFVNDQGIATTQGPPAEQTRQGAELVWPLKAGDKLSLGVGHDNSDTLDIDPFAAMTAIRLSSSN